MKYKLVVVLMLVLGLGFGSLAAAATRTTTAPASGNVTADQINQLLKAIGELNAKIDAINAFLHNQGDQRPNPSMMPQPSGSTIPMPMQSMPPMMSGSPQPLPPQGSTGSQPSGMMPGMMPNGQQPAFPMTPFTQTQLACLGNKGIPQQVISDMNSAKQGIMITDPARQQAMQQWGPQASPCMMISEVPRSTLFGSIMHALFGW